MEVCGDMQPFSVSVKSETAEQKKNSCGIGCDRMVVGLLLAGQTGKATVILRLKILDTVAPRGLNEHLIRGRVFKDN